jgi:hypothetical protein
LAFSHQRSACSSPSGLAALIEIERLAGKVGGHPDGHCVKTPNVQRPAACDPPQQHAGREARATVAIINSPICCGRNALRDRTDRALHGRCDADAER